MPLAAMRIDLATDLRELFCALSKVEATKSPSKQRLFWAKNVYFFLMSSQVPFSSTFSNSQGLVREPNHQPSDSSFPGPDIFAAPTSELKQNQMREERHLQGHAFN